MFTAIYEHDTEASRYHVIRFTDAKMRVLARNFENICRFLCNARRPTNLFQEKLKFSICSTIPRAFMKCDVFLGFHVNYFPLHTEADN